MAQKRMFDKTIIDSDEFLEMPLTTQALYFHLSMRADDDGFLDNGRAIMRIIGAKEDDMKVLISKQYLIPFETGVIVIRHWKINNYLQKDRKKVTRHLHEMQQLKEINGEYFLLEDGEISNILQLEEKETPEWQKRRDEAYKNSTLPYSFLYKIRNEFINKECPICKCTMKVNGARKFVPTIQHLKPISKGGKHELDNIAVICFGCNSSIRDKEITKKLNNKEVQERWELISRLTSGNTDKYSIDKNRIDKYSIDNNIVEKDSTVPYKEIINYLNEKASTNYRSTTRKTQDLIKARWNEHFTLDNFKKVIDNKCTEWLGTEMEKFIRPETLFGNKFESYLNQKTVSAVPKWFNEEIKEEDLTEEKVREMEKLMEDFK